MDAIRKFLVTVFGLMIAVTVSILTMIYGWGLTPKSWGWIIGCGFFGVIFAHVIVGIGTHKGK